MRNHVLSTLEHVLVPEHQISDGGEGTDLHQGLEKCWRGSFSCEVCPPVVNRVIDSDMARSLLRVLDLDVVKP